MNKNSLVIISSYSELCGNASYTKALVDEFSKIYNIEVIGLDTSLHVKEICEKIKKFDYVNIQFEAGLFSEIPQVVLKRFQLLLSHCKKAVVTMHRYDVLHKKPTFKSLLKAVIRRRVFSYFGQLNWARVHNNNATLCSDIVKICKKNNFPIIVHTPRDAQLMRVAYQYPHIYDHPLCFFGQDRILELKKRVARDDFCQYYNLPPEKTYLGVFGFIGEYKGYETVIQALQYLPENYELLIFGSQHPHMIVIEEKINPYIKSLLDLIVDKKLTSRVRFFGSPNDDQFLSALVNCDYNIVPYLEVTQGGSGIAALTLEACSRSIFSQNKAFIELAKYAPDAFKMISIGNYLELANAVLTYNDSLYSQKLQEYHANYNIHTSVALYQKLFASEG